MTSDCFRLPPMTPLIRYYEFYYQKLSSVPEEVHADCFTCMLIAF